MSGVKRERGLSDTQHLAPNITFVRCPRWLARILSPSGIGVRLAVPTCLMESTQRVGQSPAPTMEGAVNFEEAGKVIDGELKKFVEFVEEKVRPKTRQEMAQLLRKASKNLTKAAQSLEKR